MMWIDRRNEVNGDASLINARKKDYFDVFLATDAGKRVLLDLMWESGLIEVECSALNDFNARRHLILSDFMAMIKRKCGINKPMAVIEAEADIAELFVATEPEPEEENDLMGDLQ